MLYCGQMFLCVTHRSSRSVSALTEAEKQAQVAQIQWNQKIMEKESLQKMSLIEGGCFQSRP